MSHSNPLGWGRAPSGKWNSGKIARSEQQLCTRLSEIFVEKTGLAHAISLQTDPITGQKAIHFRVSRESTIPQELLETTIRGIPLYFEYQD